MVDPAGGGLRYNLGALGNGSRMQVRPQQAVQDRMGLRDGMWGLALHGVCLKRELKMSDECCRLNVELWYTRSTFVRAHTHVLGSLFSCHLLSVCYVHYVLHSRCLYSECD